MAILSEETLNKRAGCGTAARAEHMHHTVSCKADVQWVSMATVMNYKI